MLERKHMKPKRSLLALITGAVFLVSASSAMAASTSKPSVTTKAASSVTTTSAVLNGTVNPHGLATTVQYQWGTTQSLGSFTPAQQIPAGTVSVSIPPVSLTNLSPGTKYYFRAVGANTKGTTNGSTLSVTLPTPPKHVFLTFDDGPAGGPSGYTARVLSYLEAAGAHATFFETGAPTSYPTTGMAVPANQPLLTRQLADGDQIGTHTWDHPNMPDLSAADQQTEIQKARDLQVSLTGGYDSKIFRYPFFHDAPDGNAYLDSQGMMAWWADIAPEDWNAAVSDRTIINDVMSKVFDYAIVDLHDGTDVLDRGAPTYLPTLLSRLKAAGYEFDVLPSMGGGAQALKSGGAQAQALRNNVTKQPANSRPSADVMASAQRELAHQKAHQQH